MCDRPEPVNPYQAAFSIQHTVAEALVTGGMRRPLDPADPAVAALRARVRFEVAEPFASAYPDHWGSEVRVRTRDGEERSREVRDALGDPENPLSPDRVAGKARQLLASAGFPEADVTRALGAVDVEAGLPGLGWLVGRILEPR